MMRAAAALTGLNALTEDLDMGSKILKHAMKVYYSRLHVLQRKRQKDSGNNMDERLLISSVKLLTTECSCY